MRQGSSRSAWLRPTLCAVAATTVFALAGADPGFAADAKKKRTFSVDEIVNYFDTIVFGSELDPKYAARMISKWQGPIGYSIQGKVTKENKTFIEAYLRTLSKLTALQFKQVDPNAGDTISLVFVKTSQMGKIPVPAEYRSDMEIAAVNANCYFLSWKQPESRYVKALIVANVDKDRAILNSCLLEEITQSLGLPNDSDTLRPSVFSDKDVLFKLAPQDEILLYTLYHPDMKPGYNRAQARKAARAIISGLAKRKKKPSK